MSGNEKGSDLPENQGGNQHGGDNTLNFGADSTAAILSVNNPMDIELKVEKTEIPEDLQITKELRGKEIWHIYNKPMILPYDKNLLSKVEKGAEISANYFRDVLQFFIEDTLPDFFPKGYYKEVVLDSPPRWISINPQSHSNFQYSFNIDFFRTEYQNTSGSPKNHETTNIRTSVHLSSKIFHPSANDPITNGFFPRSKDDKLLPVEGVSIRVSHTNFELPSIISDDERVYIAELAAPILQTLLGDSPLFFPDYPTKYNITIRDTKSSRFGSPTIYLKDSEIATIGQARECREKLILFLNNNKEQLKLLAEEFASAKKAAGLRVDKPLRNYKPEFLFKHLNEVNKKIEDFRKNVPTDLGFKELFQIEEASTE